MKTNAARILDQLKISYELRSYEVSEDELDALSVARKIGMEASAVFKTLVMRSDRKAILMACVPADAEVDLKRLAAVSGNKSVVFVAVRELFDLTGYVRGGCSPLGSKKRYPVYIDSSAESHKQISVSAGTRGLQLVLAPQDLARATGARLEQIAKYEITEGSHA